MFSGSDENNETLSLQRRMELRKTRLELLGKEYEVRKQLTIKKQQRNIRDMIN